MEQEVNMWLQVVFLLIVVEFITWFGWNWNWLLAACWTIVAKTPHKYIRVTHEYMHTNSIRVHTSIIRVHASYIEAGITRLCPKIEDLIYPRYLLLRSSSRNTEHGSFEASANDKRRLDRNQNERDSPRILVINSMFKTREESDPRLVSKIDLILHSNINITEASSRHVIRRPTKFP